MTNTRPSPDFAALVVDWRRTQRLSLEKASSVLGVAHTTIRDWERGRRPRPLHELRLQQHLAAPVATTVPMIPSLRNARAQAGFTQRQLARTIYASPSSVAQWERGTRRPTSADIRRLGDALGQPENAVMRWFADAPPRRREGVELPALRSLRIRSGLSQRTLAAVAGCAPATWAGWEGGNAVPFAQLGPISTALGIYPRALITAPDTPEMASTPTLRDLRRAARRTQADSARFVGVSTAALSRMERGRQLVTMTIATSLADCYEQPVAAVVRASGLHRGVLLDHARWFDHELPELLRTLRTEVGLSCRLAAQLIGIGVGTLRHWERGTREPTAVHRARVARVYHGTFVHETESVSCSACAILSAWPQQRRAWRPS